MSAYTNVLCKLAAQNFNLSVNRCKYLITTNHPVRNILCSVFCFNLVMYETVYFLFYSIPLIFVFVCFHLCCPASQQRRAGCSSDRRSCEAAGCQTFGLCSYLQLLILAVTCNINLVTLLLNKNNKKKNKAA